MFASGRSLVQWSPTECGMPDNDNEAWIMKRPWPTGGYCTMGKSRCDEYIRTDMVQMNWRLSLCDHRRFTEPVHHVGLSGMFKELLVESLTVNGLSGGELQYSCSDKIDL